MSQRVVVCGPPGSGKSTWVRTRSRPGDLVWDLDDVASVVGFNGQTIPRHQRGDLPFAVAGAVLVMRDGLLAWLAQTELSVNVFIIIAAEGKARAVAEQIGATLHICTHQAPEPSGFTRACPVVGCGQTAPCPIHHASATSPARPGSWAPRRRPKHKLYNTEAWQRFRRAYLNEHPLCVACQQQGVTTLATDVHHKVDLADGGAPLDEANVEALCRSCHGRETRRRQTRGVADSLKRFSSRPPAPICACRRDFALGVIGL